MALRNAVLAALLDAEASGYDLAKGFDGSVANFWTATPQQLYRELDRMEAEGLIEARVVRQERRPDKRVFSLTEDGRRTLRAFTAKPPKPGAIRDELLVQVHAIEAGDRSAVRAAVTERRKRAEAKTAHYEKLRARVLDGRSEQEFLRDAERVGPYLTLLRGLAFEQENIRWADLVLATLDQRAEQHG